MAAQKEHKDLSKATLTARLRDAGRGPVPFVFALSKSGKNHHLVLHRKKSGKSLLTFVRGKQPDAGKAAYGTATLTPTGLQLDCEKVLPGMATAAKVWVATNRHPKVKKIKVLVGGTEVEEEEPRPKDAALIEARLKRLGGKIKPLAKTPSGKDAGLKVSEAGVFLRKNEFPRANALLDEAEKLIPVAEKELAGAARPKDAALIEARLKRLARKTKRTAKTPSGKDAVLKVSEAGVFLRKSDFPRANALLDEAEQLIPKAEKELAEAEKNRAAEELDAKFKQRLKALLPKIQKAAGTPEGTEAKLAASEAGVFARKKDFARANSLLDEAQHLMRGADEKFQDRLSKLLPRIKKAAETPAGKEANLKASEAGVFARKKDFARANALLDEAQTLLKSAASAARKKKPSAPAGAGDAVDKRAVAGALTGWRVARKQVRRDLAKLGKAAAATDGPEGVKLLKRLRTIQAKLIEAPHELREVAALERYVKTDDDIKDIEKSKPHGVAVAISKPLLKALLPLKTALGGN